MSRPPQKPGLGQEKLHEAMLGKRPSRVDRATGRQRAARFVDRIGRSPSMRNAAAPSPGHASQSTTPPPPLRVIALNRLAFGPRAGDLAAFDALGADDDSRLTAYLDEQLDPAAIDDSACDARIASSGYQTLGKSQTQLWADHFLANPEWAIQMQPVVETKHTKVLRAVYSRRQLFEVMVDFWHNHFSIYGWGGYEGPLWVCYDRDVIRANALGNFRTLLEAISRSPPMLFFLDNWLNSKDGPNENYGREFLELHTLGEEIYYGAVPRSEIPTDAQGVQQGFCEEDVFAVTRCLTGWGVDGSTPWDPATGNGTFVYRHDWHDTTSKNVLGVVIPAGQPAEKDFLDVLDLIAGHPGTARFVCRKIARRLIADDPPEEVVEAAAQVFLAQSQAPDQIAQVVRNIAMSSAFRTTWGEKVKRPLEIIVSAMRAGGAEFPFIEGEPHTDVFTWLFYLTGHYSFFWGDPDGYPDTREAWISSGPRVLTWRLTNWLVEIQDPGGVHRLDTRGQTPAGVRSANALADFWIDRVLGRPMSSADRQKIVDFMAQGSDPNVDLPLETDPYVHHRLQSMVGLLFLTPDFLWR